MSDRFYDSSEGEFVDFSTLEDWELRDAAKDARIQELEAENRLFKTAGIIEIAARNNRVTEYMFHWEGRALDAEAKLTATSQSREHFKRSAEKQRQRCHNLRHRQRALMAALQNVKDCTSIETAKFIAYIALGGWGDDELVYKSRTTLAELKGQDDV